MAIALEQIELLPKRLLRLLRWNDNVRDVEMIGDDGTVHPFAGAGETWHYHPEMELTLVTRGAGTRFLGDDITPFRAVNLVLIGANVPHYWHGLHDSAGCAIQFNPDPAYPFWHLAELAGLRPLWEQARRGIHVKGRTLQTVAALMTAMTASAGPGRLARFLSILEALLAAPPGDLALLSRTAFTASGRESVYRGIQRAISLILNRFDEHISRDDVLRETNMSRATFARQFKRHTGKTFGRFLAEVRIDYAGRQLVETDRSVGEIAFAAGFGSLSHFNHRFRAFRGLSPTAFRRRMTGTG